MDFNGRFDGKSVVQPSDLLSPMMMDWMIVLFSRGWAPVIWYTFLVQVIRVGVTRMGTLSSVRGGSPFGTPSEACRISPQYFFMEFLFAQFPSDSCHEWIFRNPCVICAKWRKSVFGTPWKRLLYNIIVRVQIGYWSRHQPKARRSRLIIVGKQKGSSFFILTPTVSVRYRGIMSNYCILISYFQRLTRFWILVMILMDIFFLFDEDEKLGINELWCFNILHFFINQNVGLQTQCFVVY